MWGFSSSPLVVNDLVVVYAGGGKGKGLLAYHFDSGEPAWTAPFGTDSYSSPQLISVGGVEQISMLSDAGVVSVSPRDGAILWSFASPDHSPRSVQPHRVDDSHMLIANGLDLGVTMVGVDHADSGWKTQSHWTSRGLKPSFNDFVILNDAAYGLDANILSCIDLKTGERKWKSGRYGYGQVMLLAVQQMLLVSTDDGEVVLVAADPASHREVGRFKAIEGKTWNHVALARGKLFIRNGQEIAAFDLTGNAGK
jgi:outer membrane protein assembly factor BamB